MRGSMAEECSRNEWNAQSFQTNCRSTECSTSSPSSFFLTPTLGFRGEIYCNELMKRKNLENDYDDFYCFSVPATKSRRLVCELPTIIEEEPASGLPVELDQDFLLDNSHPGNVLLPNETPSISAVPVNDQGLAIVMYNPVNAITQGLVKSPSSSDFSFVMNPELLSGWQRYMLHQGNQSRVTITESDEDSDENKSFQSNNSMAVVPWIESSQQHPFATRPNTQTMDMPLQPMEAADTDYEMMETDDQSCVAGYNNQDYIQNIVTKGGAQAALPHCLMPQYPPNTCTPIRW